MIIRDEHLEWATIERMSEMLAAPHIKYNVTHSYAFFVPIICWVVQRYRDRTRPIQIYGWNRIGSEFEEPWLASHTIKVVELSVIDYLVGLRNAVAHGDDRSVRPINHSGKLWGYHFQCETSARDVLSWKSAVDLSGSDLRRIGLAAATCFRSALLAQVPDARDGLMISEVGQTQKAATRR